MSRICRKPPSATTQTLSRLATTIQLWLGRVKFGPLGWNVTYNFGDADLDAAFKLLGRFVDDLHADTSTPSLAALPVESLVYVTGNITYGGWVTDEWDRRCLLAVLDHFYSASIFGDAVRKNTNERGTVYRPYTTLAPTADSRGFFLRLDARWVD